MKTISAERVDLSRSLDLEVQRSGIRFHNIAPDRVRIEIEVENRGSLPSEPISLRIEAAPFGAFLPWRPLAALPVPTIPAGGMALVETVARQPRPKPVGDFSGLVPPAILVAAGADEARGHDGGRRTRPYAGKSATALQTLAEMAAWLRVHKVSRRWSRKASLDFADRVLHAVQGRLVTGPVRSHRELPPDLFDLLDRQQPHWAGNLKVWVARRPVERHVAPGWKVCPGRTNLVSFFLGDRRDEYSFRMEAPLLWQFSLYDGFAGKSIEWSEDPGEFPADSGRSAHPGSRWHAVKRMQPMLLAFRPPQTCARGRAQLHVIQRSSGEEAVVELELDPAARGAGCYIL